MTEATNPQHDRYVSFCGIECDVRANDLMDRLKDTLGSLPEDHQWRTYFDQKFVQQAKQGADNLHFAGSQVNTLNTFFEEMDDDVALDMLWHLEQDCC